MSGSRGRRTFGPVVLLGLASAGLLAVGGTKSWVRPTGDAVLSPALGTDTGEVPLAGALALVVLAAWGVLLVTRGRLRRVLAVIGALAAAAAVVTVVRGPDQASATLALELGVKDVGTTPTGWFWVTAVAAPLALLATLAAVRLVGSWPAMGSRYDAPRTDTVPTGVDGAEAHGVPQSDAPLDMWRALDRGHDPTA